MYTPLPKAYEYGMLDAITKSEGDDAVPEQ